MHNRETVYLEFGRLSELMQLIEIEIGNILLEHSIPDLENIEISNRKKLLENVNSKTLGRLIKELGKKDIKFGQIEKELTDVLSKRNYIAHHFFRTHNLRINSESGCGVMIKELKDIHKKMLDLYREILLISANIDIFTHNTFPNTESHLQI